MEPTLFDSALLDTIIYNFVLTKEQAFTGHPRNPLMLFCSEAKVLELQAYISSNYVALHQNPINVLLRMTSKALLSSFVLRPFCNLLLQLFHSLYKYVCYGFATFTMHRRTNLDPTHINALQESAAVNVVLELLHQPIPRGVEMNVSSFIRSLTSKTTFTDEVITNSGLPPNPLLSSVDLRVAEERALERVGERFLAAAETLMKTSSGSAPNVVDGVTFSQQEGAEKLPCLRPYSAGDVATYHLYNVLLQLFEMPELSKAPANLEEDSNAQCLARVINAYWRCLQCGSTSSLVLDFIKSSISIVLRLHYLCPWMVTKSTEQLQSWMHAERGKEPELQEFANLRQIYHDLMEMEKLDEAELTRDAAKGK
ncbi:pyridine nucleotide transhydrogenase, putative [Babesia caballi]|uniref:Pyridine nucleotide transhydrogenase, putative n=1 Tax=Babesia caballi TaxID=5871 RepID=A0AAV4LLL4_BABCB|nr:pyridine nucleotide transhydrogenase, putative [Babesia caballi]